MTDFSPLSAAEPLRRIKTLYYRRMLDRGEGSTRSSESESESMEVPGEGTPPSVGSKEEKVEVPGEGSDKIPNGTSPEVEKEKPKPRASVMEYKSVSQM